MSIIQQKCLRNDNELVLTCDINSIVGYKILQIIKNNILLINNINFLNNLRT